MGAQYEPGTVAVATVRGVKGVRVLRYGQMGGCPGWVSGPYVKGFMHHADSHLTDVRPLVVLDLDVAASHIPNANTERICFHLRNAGSTLAAHIAEQIEAQTRPPEPPEPTGRWTVVEGRDGNRWLRVPDAVTRTHPWRHIGAIDRWSSWEYIVGSYAPVVVLSPGVAA